MADRRQPPNAPQRVRAPAPPTGGVRRNLFTSQLTRRPTPTSSNNSAETLRLDAAAASAAASLVDVHDDEGGEIVVRDQHGEIELADPPSPEVDELDEGALDDRQENERERQRLAEAVKIHQVNHAAVAERPEELLEVVRASLRAKVAGLAEDNWMYEAEEPPRG
ncbi:hypothetical protein CC79DRAFT_1368332 [Sarocladium strictum]